MGVTTCKIGSMNEGAMKLISASVAGFEGVPPDKPLQLLHFGHRNLFIGQNNSGKSIIFRFLHRLIKEMTGHQLYSRKPLGDLYADSFWQSEGIHPIIVDLAFSTPSQDLEPSLLASSPTALLIKDGVWQVRSTITFNPQTKHATLDVMPLAWVGTELKPIAHYPQGSNNPDKFLFQNGSYGSDPSASLAHIVLTSINQPFQDWLARCRFFDAVRALNKTSSVRHQFVEDGSTLLQEIKSLRENNATIGDAESWEKDLLLKLNELFDPPFTSLRIQGNPPEFWLKKGRGTSTPLSRMGMGVSQMFIAYARLIRDVGRPYTYFIEEPESNLHPRLLRGFMQDMSKYSTIQFFITSHSNVTLDSVGPQDRVYHFSQDANGACSAIEVSDIAAHHDVLDALGVTGTSLLQTNCAIWVEGPSDRLYLRKWLEELAAKNGESLRENIDYSFVIYGGSILSHFEFGSSALNDLISLIRLCRFSAVTMDLNDGLTPAQSRVLDEAKKDPKHRLACHTDNREIENDIEPQLFLDAVSNYLAVDRARFEGWSLTNDSRFVHQIAKRLSSTEAEQKKIARKLGDKVELAQSVLKVCTETGQSLGRPSYVQSLFDLITRSRCSERAK